MGAQGPGEDPIKFVQEMIHEAHYELAREVEKLMVDHENKLRGEIKKVLRRYAQGDKLDRTTPLDQKAEYPPDPSSPR